MRDAGQEQVIEQALLVAQIRGKIPRVVHIPHYWNQGVSSWEWNQDLQQYVAVKQEEE